MLIPTLPNPKIYLYGGMAIFIAALAFFAYYQYNKVSSVQADLALQIERNSKNETKIQELGKSLEESNKNFDNYKILIEENLARLSALEEMRVNDRMELEQLKSKVTSKMLKDRALNDENFKKTINDETKKLINDFRDLSK